MALSDTRYSFRDNEDPESVPDIRSSATAIRAEREGEARVPVFVQAEASHLVVVAGPDGDQPAGAPPRGVTSVELRDPDGVPVTPIAPDAGVYGQMIFVVENPRQGIWSAVVRYTADSNFVIRATALRERAMERLRSAWPKLACTGCKEGLHAAVAAAAFYVAGMIAGAAGLPALAIGALASRFRLPERIIEHLLKRVADVSLDRLIEEACVEMGFCPPARGA